MVEIQATKELEKQLAAQIQESFDTLKKSTNGDTKVSTLVTDKVIESLNNSAEKSNKGGDAEKKKGGVVNFAGIRDKMIAALSKGEAVGTFIAELASQLVAAGLDAGDAKMAFSQAQAAAAQTAGAEAKPTNSEQPKGDNKGNQPTSADVDKAETLGKVQGAIKEGGRAA